VILFTIGTSVPFDRLVAVADAVAEACDEPVLVQGGRSQCELTRAELVPFIPSDELRSLVAEARVVVMHAGAGSALLALDEAKRPVLVPRLRRFGEAIDDHQVDFGRRLEAIGLAHLVVDPEALPAFLASLPPDEKRPVARTPSLAAALREHLHERLGPPREAPS
jgi:UDP-N-acetylglucosamine transferase subunit ALG13